MSSKQALLDSLAGLFTYPGAQDDFAERLAACRDLVEERFSGRGEMLSALLERSRGMSRGEIEEMFTRTFEINPVCALEVGWHVYGEDYARGALMVRLREELRERGIPELTELPDHLTHVLQLLSRLEKELADDLAGRYVIPALEKMLAAIEEQECPYEELLAMTRDVVRDTHDAVVVEPPARRQAPPESEQRGLPILQPRNQPGPQNQHSVCGPGCAPSDATAWEAKHGI